MPSDLRVRELCRVDGRQADTEADKDHQRRSCSTQKEASTMSEVREPYHQWHIMRYDSTDLFPTTKDCHKTDQASSTHRRH